MNKLLLVLFLFNIANCYPQPRKRKVSPDRSASKSSSSSSTTPIDVEKSPQKTIASKPLLQKKIFPLSLLNVANEGNIELANLLIEDGANVNAVNAFGWTPLHFAAKKKDEKMVSFLLDNGANLNAVNKNNETPLFIAAEVGAVEVVRLLLQQPQIDAHVKTKYGYTAFRIAQEKKYKNIVYLLFDYEFEKK